MKVGFFIWALKPAGAERVLSILANAWAARGWEVVVFTMDAPNATSFYPLAPSVELRHLDLLRSSGGSVVSALTNNLTRIRSLRSVLLETRPDVVISFIDKTNIVALLASRGLGLPVIISERTDPSRRSIGRLWDTLRRLTYPFADGIVFQSQAVADWFSPRITRRGMVIPNPVPAPPASGEPLSKDPGNQRLVTMGRLVPVKGFDVLIEAFATIQSQVPNWRLEMWGAGPELEPLQQRAKDLGVSVRVQFCGVTQKPFDVLRRGDLFVMSSHAEGFPNALVEAMACGLPVISTRFGGAAEDIIQHSENGLLVPPADPKALGEAMLKLMLDPATRAQLGAKATGVVQRFSTERVLALWDEAINRAMSRKPGKAQAPRRTLPAQ